MPDIAQLGFQVDTSPIDKASQSLTAIVPAGAAAETAAESVSEALTGTSVSASELATILGGMSATVRALNPDLTGLSNSSNTTSAAMDAASASTAAATATINGYTAAQIDAMKVQQAATVIAAEAKITQDALNSSFGIGTIAKSAKDSATAFQALEPALVNTTKLSAGASVELGRIGGDIMLGRIGRLESALLVMSSRLGEGGSQALTFGNAFGALGGIAELALNPVILSFIALEVAMQVIPRLWDAINVGTKDATETLKDHDTWLSTILQGYKDAKQQADQYVTTANALPQGAVNSDLTANASTNAKNYTVALNLVKTSQTAFLQNYIIAHDTIAKQPLAMAATQSIQTLQQSLNSSKPSLDNFLSQMTMIKNNAPDHIIAQVASNLITLATNAKAFAVNAGADNAALLASYTTAANNMKTLVPNSLDTTTKALIQARNDLTTELDNAPDQILRSAAIQNYQQTVAAIKAANDSVDFTKFTDAAQGIQTQTDALNVQNSTVGQSASVIASTKAGQDLWNDAMNAGIPVTAALAQTIEGLANAYGQSAQAAAQAALASNLAFNASQLGLSKQQQAKNSLLRPITGNDTSSATPQENAQAEVSAAVSDLLGKTGTTGGTASKSSTAAAQADIATIKQYGAAAGLTADQINTAITSETHWQSLLGSDKSTAKATEDFKKLYDSTTQYIAKETDKQNALGQSAQVTLMASDYQNLLNKAQNDNLKLTPVQTAQLKTQAAAMADATVKTNQLTAAYNFGSGIVTGFVSDLNSQLSQSPNLWTAFETAGLNALSSIGSAIAQSGAQNLFNSLFTSTGGNSGSGVWGFLGSLLGGGSGGGSASAKGNVFAGSNGLAAYRNTIVSKPTYFAKGGAPGLNLMGEAGTEAVVPLKRTSNGDLGVQIAGSSGDGGSGDTHYHDSRQYHITGSANDADAIASAVKAYDNNLPTRLNEIKNDPMKRRRS